MHLSRLVSEGLVSPLPISMGGLRSYHVDSISESIQNEEKVCRASNVRLLAALFVSLWHPLIPQL